METIRRHEALTDMEIHEENQGKKHIFSIRFVNKQGEVVYLPYAYSSGLRADMKKNRLRGVNPCSPTGISTGHVTPVSIDNIIEYNHQTVIL